MIETTRTLLLLTALLLPAAAARAQAPTQASPRPAAEKGDEGPRRHETVRFESRLVGAPLPYNVVLPADYGLDSSKQKRYPVLYLLHGLTGSAGDWVSARARLAEHAARYPFIVVVPEGRNGWYTDSATAPAEKFESYFVGELIPDVDARFRTVPAREAKAGAAAR